MKNQPLSKRHQKLIQFVIDRFDFELVCKVMDYTGWEWNGLVPDRMDVRGMALTLCREAVLHECGIRHETGISLSHPSVFEMGGLRATFNGRVLSLEFILTENAASL